MPTTDAYADRVRHARESRRFEPMREKIQNLINAGYSRAQLPSALGVGRSGVELMLAALEIRTHGKAGRPPRERRYLSYEEEETVRDLAMQRAEEHHWVRCFREAYGPVGRGFSTA